MVKEGQKLRRVGIPAPQAEPTRQIVWANTVPEAEAVMSETFAALTIQAPGNERRLRMRLESVALPQLVISDLELTTALVRGERYPWFAFCIPVQGEVRVTSSEAAGVVADGYGAVLPPDELVTVDFRTGHGRIRTVMIEKNALENELTMMLGRGLDHPLQFDFQIDTATSGAALRRSLSIFSSELTEPGAPLAAPATAARLGQLVMAGLLVSWRHNYSDQLAASAGDGSPQAIQVAVRAIENDPMGFHSVSQIARTSALSVRALEEGFQRHVGVSPMRYLRLTRLARAHAVLLAADAEQTTATAVAYAWGFPHYGRFAAEYRKQYGRSPAETLRSKPIG
jgi:AraC-like DNA-binding protein